MQEEQHVDISSKSEQEKAEATTLISKKFD